MNVLVSRIAIYQLINTALLVIVCKSSLPIFERLPGEHFAS